VSVPVGPPEGRTDPARLLLSRLRGRTIRQQPRRSARPTPQPGEYSGPAPDARDPQSVGAAVTDLVDQRGWEKGTRAGRVFADWAELVGPDVAQHCQPEALDPQSGVLRVRADSTAWATQLRLLLPAVEAAITAHVGPTTVTSVQVLGPAAPSWRKGRRTVPGRGPRDTYG
jgi:predicted nucleic acid-binding Zn ribbon protein